ncbi:MAG TPA: DUF1080 domain-containing protein [Povalibacter sp.]
MRSFFAIGLFVIGAMTASAKEPVPLFDGNTLKGWHPLGGGADYKVAYGAIVGSTRHGIPNSFLVTDRTYGDFILEFDTRQDVGPANSGVQFRSQSEPSFENGRVYGYQAEIDPSDRAWSGSIYDEAKRGWLYTGELNPPGTQLYRYGEWNHYRIEALGPQLRVWINSKPASHVIDDVLKQGFIGLQVHSIGKPDEAGRLTSWKNIQLQTQDLKPAPPMGIFIRNLLPNDLDAQEKAQGWRLLWDGKSTKGWRASTGTTFPAKGWTLNDGVLAVQPKVRGGDIVTEEEFGAFELQLDFMTTTGANSGIIYLLTAATDPNSGGAPLGLEYQILDDQNHPDAKQGIDGNRTLASLYDIFPRATLRTSAGIAPKLDVWQHARIVCRADGSVEHWLNGSKVLEFNRKSPEFRAKVATSKFKATPNYGDAPRGRILLQDHGDDVRFRSIKIRPL